MASDKQSREGGVGRTDPRSRRWLSLGVDSDDEDVPLAARKRPKPSAESEERDGSVAMAVNIAKATLARGAIGDHAGILSLLGAPITRQTPFEQQRNAYRQLAKILHPDRLSRHFTGATK